MNKTTYDDTLREINRIRAALGALPLGQIASSSAGYGPATRCRNCPVAMSFADISRNVSSQQDKIRIDDVLYSAEFADFINEFDTQYFEGSVDPLTLVINEA